MYNQKIKPYYIIGLGIVFLFCMMIWAIKSYGPGLTADSIIYLSTGKNLVEKLSFTRFDGEALSNWAPLYPCIMAFGYLLPINILWFALGLNFIAIAITGFVTYHIIKKHIHQSYAIPFILICSLAFPYYKLIITVYSESIFICFQAFFLMYFLRYFYSQSNKQLYISAIFMALMCLQRYAGFMMLLVAILILLTDENIKYKIKSTLIFIAISFLPSLPWLIKNYVVSGGLTGQHTVSGKLNPSNLGLNLYHILVYLQVHYGLLFLFGSLIFFWGATLYFHQKNTIHTATKKAAKALWFYCSAYLFLLLLQKSLHLFEMARYLSVLYVPMICYAAMFIDEWYKKYQSDKTSELALKYILIGITALQCFSIMHHIYRTKEMGVGGFGTDWWTNKELSAFVKEKTIDKKVMSNYPDFMWLINAKEYHFSQYKGEPLDEYKLRDKGDEYLLWFKQPMRQTLIEPQDTMVLGILENTPAYTFYKLKKVLN